MVTVYSREYLDEFEVVDKSFHYPKNPNAKAERDRMARELRKQGWKVTVKKFSFQDLGYGDSYTLYAERKRIPVTETDWLWYEALCSLGHMAASEQITA